MLPERQSFRPFSRRGEASDYRGDLQGLRALAVLLVALSHAGIGFFAGGFVGVDVFFVLSGFLITQLLLSEAMRRGFVSFAGFYSRRARRILPAAALTLVVTDIACYHLLNFVRAKQAILDSIWASLFAANVHFARVGTDYFTQGQPPSPVQHFWSLAVEEQFYLIWPLLIALALFGRARRRRPRTFRPEQGAGATLRVFIVMNAIAIASFAWAMHETSAAPTSAYFSTFSRAWELALGAVLAAGSHAFAGRRAGAHRTRAGLGWLGLAAIVAAAVLYSGKTPFPGLAALVPTVGAALVIYAGMGEQVTPFTATRALSLAPLRYTGDRSYSFYLWHWPVLIIAAQYEGHPLSSAARLGLLAFAFLLSIVSYAFFENPIRRASWVKNTTAATGLWIGAVASVAVVSVSMLHAIDAESARLDAEVARARSTETAASSRPGGQTIGAARANRPLPAVVAAVKAARRAEPIPPVLIPSFGELQRDAFQLRGCGAANGQTSRFLCHFGDTAGSTSIVVIGDSHAQMWMPAIVKMAIRDREVVIPFIKFGCIPAKWSANTNDGNEPGPAECRQWYRWAIEQIKALHPTIALVTGEYGGSTGHRAEVVESALVNSAITLERSSGSVVVVADDDGVSRQPVDCLLARSATMRSCTTTWPKQHFAVNDYLAATARRLGFGFLDTRGWFCFENECPIVVGHTIVFRDTNHMTTEYALELALPFRVAFKAALADLRSG